MKGIQPILRLSCPCDLDLSCGLIVKAPKERVCQERPLARGEPHRLSLQNYFIHNSIIDPITITGKTGATEVERMQT